MKLAIMISAMLGASTQIAFAQDHISMICKNDRQEYRVELREKENKLVVTAPGTRVSYKIDKIRKENNRISVKGETLKNGPHYIAEFRGQKSISYYTDGQRDQKDNCR